MKYNKFVVQPFTNKRNNQISLAVLKRNTSKKSLDVIGDKDVKFLEVYIKKVVKKDKLLNDKTKL